MNTIIKQLEQISFNAWPSLKTILYDNWVIRISDGVTRRANSINPIFDSSIEIEEKISFCETLFFENNLAVVYKLTNESYPQNLDSLLETKGYYLEAETSVQTMNLNNTCRTKQLGEIIISEKLEHDWLMRSLEFNEYDLSKKDGFERIMNSIVMKCAFLDLKINNEYIGCGLGVIEGNYIGIFDIVVSKKYRGQGFGKYIVESLLHFGIQNGCKTAYLQVMINNPIARNLYKNIGFTEVYKYWYRVKDKN